MRPHVISQIVARATSPTQEESLVLANLIGQGANFLSILIIARILPPSAFGDFGFSLSLSGAVGGFASSTVGLASVGASATGASGVELRPVMRAAMRLACVSAGGMVFVAGVGLATRSFAFSTATASALAAVAVFPACITAVAVGRAIGQSRGCDLIKAQLVRGVVSIALAVTFGYIWGFVGALLGLLVGATAMSFYLLRRLDRLTNSSARNSQLRIDEFGGMFLRGAGLSAFLGMLGALVPNLRLAGGALSMVELGLYNLSAQFRAGVGVVSSAMGSAALADMASEADFDARLSKCRSAMSRQLVVIASIAAVMVIGASAAERLLYREYHGLGFTTFLLCGATMLGVIPGVLGQLFASTADSGSMALLNGVALLSIVSMSFLFSASNLGQAQAQVAAYAIYAAAAALLGMRWLRLRRRRASHSKWGRP